MSNRSFLTRLTLAAMLLVAAACGDDEPTHGDRFVAAVRLSRTQEALLIGQTLQLDATPIDDRGVALEDRQVTWRSENVAVASVGARGLVTARAAGSTHVVATSEGKEARAAITVTAPAPAQVASVKLAPTELALQLPQSGMLEATPRDAHGMPLEGRVVTWTTADDGVATVSSLGVVTAVAVGTTRITATVEGKEAHATVTVAPAPPAPVASVALDATTFELEEGATRQLVATPRDAQGAPIEGLAVTWTTSDENVAHVGALGLVTGIRSGTATITARVNGKVAQAAVTVSSSAPWDLVYVAHDDPAAGGAGTWSLYHLNVGQPGAAPSRITAVGNSAYTPEASPDGTLIAFAGTVDGEGGIHVANRDGTGRRRVVSWAQGVTSEPTWSPDGAKLAYTVMNIHSGADVWVVNADGANPVNVTVDVPATSQHSPAWSPTLADGGSRIAFVQYVQGMPRIWTMRPDGSDKRQLTTGESDVQPAWSPDGRTIAFQRSSASIFGDIWLVDADGGEERALMPFATLAGPQWAPEWSPDGRLVAFTSSHETYGSAPSAPPVLQVYTVWADGTRLARRTGPDAIQKSQPTWVRR